MIKNTKYLTRLFVEALLDGDLVVKHKKLGRRGPVGLCVCGYFIWFDSRQFDPIRIVVHELTHYLWPDMKEREVRRVENWYTRMATWGQKKKVIQAIIDVT